MAGASPASQQKSLSAQLVVQYVGFHDAPGRREYVLLAQIGDRVRQYTLSIALEAFAERRALLQDGPDVCYQKLTRELVVAGLDGASRLPVSDADLLHYRDTHAPPARRPHPRRVVTDVASAGAGSNEESA